MPRPDAGGRKKHPQGSADSEKNEESVPPWVKPTPLKHVGAIESVARMSEGGVTSTGRVSDTSLR
jgi:hypothetical protein